MTPPLKYPALAVPALPPPDWLSKDTLLKLTHLPMCVKTRELAKYYDPILTTKTYRRVRSTLQRNKLGDAKTYAQPAMPSMQAYDRHLERLPYLLLEVLMCHKFKVPQFLELDCANADIRAHRVLLHDVLYPIKTAGLTEAALEFNNYEPQPASAKVRLLEGTPKLDEDLRRMQRNLEMTDPYPIEFKEINIWHAL